METKHSVWKKLLASGSALGALLLSAGSVHAANPDTVTLGALDQGVGLSENSGNSDRVAFTAHSYVAYAASDVTGVHDGTPFTGVHFTNVATPVCAPGIPLGDTQDGTNLFDGDIWYVGCIGVYSGLEAKVTVH